MCVGNQDDILGNKKIYTPLFIYFRLNNMFLSRSEESGVRKHRCAILTVLSAPETVEYHQRCREVLVTSTE